MNFILRMTGRELSRQAWRLLFISLCLALGFAAFFATYGFSGRVLAGIRADPAGGRPLLEGHPFCPAEIRHILAFENAPTLMDMMMRRTEMQLTVDHRQQPGLAAKVAEIMGSFYGWEYTRLREELRRYLDYVRNTISFLQEPHG